VRDFIAALDAKTGKVVWRKYVIPAPGEPGSETWRQEQRLANRRRGHVDHRPYDVATNRIWEPAIQSDVDPTYRPGDNLYTNSMIS
jgi:alcohol dehydrogenase (cytochrome c)